MQIIYCSNPVRRSLTAYRLQTHWDADDQNTSNFFNIETTVVDLLGRLLALTVNQLQVYVSFQQTMLSGYDNVYQNV